MADIPALIARLRDHRLSGQEAMRAEAADAIESLAASPLPEEIAEIIRHLGTSVTETEAAAALERQATKIAELESDYLRRHKDACDRWERIRELEAERDAIRAKTIEDCDSILQRKIDAGHCEPRIVKVLQSMQKHIRALNQPPASKDQSNDSQ